MTTRTATAILIALAALALPSAARADRRYYGETYTAVTAPQGALDVELWSTYHAPPSGDPAGSPWVLRHQAELETGITDRWDVAAYGIARQIEHRSTELEAAKLETRFALARPGEWIVDPVLYFEAVKTFVDDRPFSIEGKLILGKDLDRLNLAVNVAAEQEFAGGGSHTEGSYAAGASWEVVPALRLGAEAFGTVARETVAPGQERTQSLVWAGPALSVAWSRFWLVLAAGFGLNADSEALRARAIFAIQL
jgi:hypothetical protein